MGKQLTFKLPEINRKETQQKVEDALEMYRMFLLTVPEDKLPKVTASYSLVPPAFSNQFHSSTEAAAIDRVDFERERDDYIERIRKAVNRLNKKEREAVIRKYFGEEELFDYEIYNEMGMSESYYHQKFKPSIYYKLAFILRIVVYKDKRNENEKITNE
ncbi:ArpU family phage packaging/lysis transcriptional regulator [Metabacillus idriensis]|uniref:ArpU family phage packaging/lysis transcriptional regulator n=1 Tax=Metabacillus idriensis TaxID=324768 RepID=UPI0017481D22|nr:ArpU family phage packaging/lysis transcriptional regulator [Metabacillus idriensis]